MGVSCWGGSEWVLDLRNQGGLKAGHWMGRWSQEIVAVIQDLGQKQMTDTKTLRLKGMV